VSTSVQSVKVWLEDCSSLQSSEASMAISNSTSCGHLQVTASSWEHLTATRTVHDRHTQLLDLLRSRHLQTMAQSLQSILVVIVVPTISAGAADSRYSQSFCACLSAKFLPLQIARQPPDAWRSVSTNNVRPDYIHNIFPAHYTSVTNVSLRDNIYPNLSTDLFH